MLNSQDLQELKIEALMRNSINNYPIHFFCDLSLVLSSSCDHMLFRGDSNSNMLSFFYIMLSHIFDARAANSKQSSSSGSPSSQLNSGGSKNPEPMQHSSAHSHTQKEAEVDQVAESQRRLHRIYQLLLSSKINFDQILNIPSHVRTSVEQTGNINLCFKRLFLEFLSQLKSKYNERIRPNSKSHEPSREQSNVYSIWHRFPVCETLISIFVRCVLYTEYEITEALDFNKCISDHTVYTALCEAFFYGSLHIQENYTEIFTGNFIRQLRLKKCTKDKQNELHFYMVSLPQCKSEAAAAKEMPATDTFRLLKKNSDISNESYSFRQSPKPQVHQPFLIGQARNSKVQTGHRIQASKQQKIEFTNRISPAEMQRKNPQEYAEKAKQQLSNLVLSQTSKVKSQNNIMGIENERKKLEKCSSEHIINVNAGANRNKTEARNQLNGYTSLQILKELNPRVRESMLKTIDYYKKYNY